MVKRCMSIVMLAVASWSGVTGERSTAAESGAGRALEDILAAWKARQEMAHSLRFSWNGSVTEVVFAGALDPEAPSRDEKVVLRGRRTYSLILDGKQIKLTSEGKKKRSAPDEHLQWLDQKYVFVLNEQTHLVHFLARELEPLVPSQAPSTATIREKSGSGGISRNMHVDPVVMHFRAVDPEVTNIEGNLSLTDRTGMVEGRRCWIVWEEGRRPTEYWVDPRRDYAIVRMRSFSFYAPGQCLIDNEISYTEDVHVKWVPASWRGTWFDKETGEAEKSWEYTVSSYAINPEVDLSVFDYQLSPGTRVTDRRRSPLVQYILREGGEKRIITAAESALPYEDLLRTESGEAVTIGRTSNEYRWTALVVISLSLSALLFLAYLVRQRRLRRVY